MGRCSALLAAQETVLLSHCHSDHIAGLIAWFSAHTRRHRDRPTRVVVPEEKRSELLEALASWPDYDGVRRRIDLDEVILGARPGTKIDLADGIAAAFAVRHNTSAVGWAITRSGERRAAMAFAGDSTVEPFRDDPSLLDAEIAVVDCSFIDPGTRVAARLGGHSHLKDWIELLPDLRCDTLVLAHLPPEASAASVLERLPENLPGTATVVPWISPPR
jgi:ribonuclease BN (tRNA processing enzyme)